MQPKSNATQRLSVQPGSFDSPKRSRSELQGADQRFSASHPKGAAIIPHRGENFPPIKGEGQKYFTPGVLTIWQKIRKFRFEVKW